MSGDLRVVTAHLHELSSRQGQAASGLTMATGAVDGVDSSVRATHGPISSSTATAVQAALNARRAAGTSLARASQHLGEKLADAAGRYDQTDSATGGVLDGTIR
ncbi:ESX-1 secretion-associated protein [Mycolicibacterium sp. HK-90]|uniref:ESX-1 secretion-associated protein n=1 Tax=Mycolicibacterium sp. HK-90 TaxID=3056937 RepID=UPI002659C266|nr:ESX-1 secretion-associated protein [Mycolicibacterium sp. HK-90]WKG03626.1 ESX-1 secretion-associated protein [Mycolicibacterium sp. HK-90]